MQNVDVAGKAPGFCRDCAHKVNQRVRRKIAIARDTVEVEETLVWLAIVS